MALEIINGKVVLKADFGSGTSSISNPKWVSDNEWHEVIVERWVFFTIVHLYSINYQIRSQQSR